MSPFNGALRLPQFDNFIFQLISYLKEEHIMEKEYKSFREFYPFYLGEHASPTNKLLHMFGSAIGLICLGYLFKTGLWWFFPLGILIGYGFAWIGHFVVDKNRPATFKYPLYSFMGDWRMFFDVVTMRIPLRTPDNRETMGTEKLSET
jgi:hypothetical protein